MKPVWVICENPKELRVVRPECCGSGYPLWLELGPVRRWGKGPILTPEGFGKPHWVWMFTSSILASDPRVLDQSTSGRAKAASRWGELESQSPGRDMPRPRLMRLIGRGSPRSLPRELPPR